MLKFVRTLVMSLKVTSPELSASPAQWPAVTNDATAGVEAVEPDWLVAVTDQKYRVRPARTPASSANCCCVSPVCWRTMFVRPGSVAMVRL